MNIKNMPWLVHQEDAGNTQFEEVFYLEVQLTYPRIFVGEDGISYRVQTPKKADHARSIWHQHQNFGIQVLERLIVMVQLHHMIDTMRSGKADVENQQCIRFL